MAITNKSTTVKFGDGKIKLWRSTKSGVLGIGVNFHKATNLAEVAEIYDALRTVLRLKYGKEITSK